MVWASRELGSSPRRSASLSSLVGPLQWSRSTLRARSPPSRSSLGGDATMTIVHCSWLTVGINHNFDG